MNYDSVELLFEANTKFFGISFYRIYADKNITGYNLTLAIVERDYVGIIIVL